MYAFVSLNKVSFALIPARLVCINFYANKISRLLQISLAAPHISPKLAKTDDQLRDYGSIHRPGQKLSWHR